MTLDFDTMMAHWRRARGLEPERNDCSVEVFDGVDLTARLAGEMRQWYLKLLDTAPLKYVVQTNIASKVTLRPGSAAGLWTAALPPDVRRVTTLTLAGAPAPLQVSASAPLHFGNPYARQLQPFVSGRTLYLYAEEPVLETLMAVLDPGDEEYTFDEAALGLIGGAEALSERPCGAPYG